MKKSWLSIGALALFFLALAGVLILGVGFPLCAFPSEDAAILFIYSENLMDHGVIAYHSSSPPSEGATDFLWMVLIALAYGAGVPSYLFANLLSAVSVAVSAMLLYALAVQGRGPGARAPSFRAAMAACCALSLFLMLLPSYFAAALGFSPFFFGCCILLSAFFFVRGKAWGLALSSLATCLVRPDGVVFAVPLYLMFLASDRSRRKARLKAGLLAAALPGTLYFLWRWHYFGLPLPLPFYVKSHFDRYLLVFNRDSLLINLRVWVAVLPLMLTAWGWSWKAAGERTGLARRLLVALWPVPFLFYSCMNLEQNIAFRFQYPLILAGLAPALTALDGSAKKLRRFVLSAVWCLLILAPWYLTEGYRALCTPTENMPRTAMKLAELPAAGRIATTEAGRLPYYSGWETMDLWGLNTPELARRVVRPEEVDRFAPDLIVLHVSGDHYGDDWRFLAAPPSKAHEDRTWNHMAENTWLAAHRAGYSLFMVPHRLPEQADPVSAWWASLRPRLNAALGRWGAYDTYYAFLIRPDSPLTDALTALILQQGGIPYAQYEQEKQHFIEQQGGGKNPPTCGTEEEMGL